MVHDFFIYIFSFPCRCFLNFWTSNPISSWCIFLLSTERRILRRSVLYGHASLHYHLRPVHPSYSIVWRLPSNQHPVLAQVDAISLHGSLCISEHADCRVQWRTSHSMRRAVEVWRVFKCNLHPSGLYSWVAGIKSTTLGEHGHTPRISGVLQSSWIHRVEILPTSWLTTSVACSSNDIEKYLGYLFLLRIESIKNGWAWNAVLKFFRKWWFSQEFSTAHVFQVPMWRQATWFICDYFFVNKSIPYRNSFVVLVLWCLLIILENFQPRGASILISIQVTPLTDISSSVTFCRELSLLKALLCFSLSNQRDFHCYCCYLFLSFKADRPKMERHRMINKIFCKYFCTINYCLWYRCYVVNLITPLLFMNPWPTLLLSFTHFQKKRYPQYIFFFFKKFGCVIITKIYIFTMTIYF